MADRKSIMGKKDKKVMKNCNFLSKKVIQIPITKEYYTEYNRIIYFLNNLLSTLKLFRYRTKHIKQIKKEKNLPEQLPKQQEQEEPN